MVSRRFEDVAAKRDRVPLLVGIFGPSGGGKTFSALRLATGMQRVVGGEIFVIDTESRRALHYADLFKFRHLDFGAPFSPLDYLAAIEHCVTKGASIVVVDSMSHEHDGPGGVLEIHDAEMKRLGGGDRQKEERVKFLAWAKPKSDRRRLISKILHLGCNAVFCFRAKEKLKLERGKDPLDLGWMPIAGEDFLYEMTVNCLLHPASGGVPTWMTVMPGERAMMKLPRQFVDLLKDPVPLSEQIGEAMAKWAAGEGFSRKGEPITDTSLLGRAALLEPNPPSGLPDDRLSQVLGMIRATSTEVGVRSLAEANRDQPWSDAQRANIKRAIVAQIELLRAPKPGACDHPEGFAPSDENPEPHCVHCGEVEPKGEA